MRGSCSSPRKQQFVSFGHVVLGLRIEERGYDGIFLLNKEATEARHVSGVSMNGGPERPLCETVKLKPILPQRSQDVRNIKDMAYVLRKAANREWNQHKRKKVYCS